MSRIFSDKEVNTGRQKFLDLVKAYHILLMINMHLMMYAAEDFKVTQPVFLFISDQILSRTFGAQIFMFCMGAGMAYSRSGRSAKGLLKRGANLYAKAWLLNIARAAALYFILWLVRGDSVYLSSALQALTFIDILQFAGLAFMVMALLVKLGLKDLSILAVGGVLSVIGSLVRGIRIDSVFLNVLLGQIVGTVGENFETCFPLCNWFIYVACGMVFGNRLRHCTDVRKMLFRLFVPSAAIMAIYCAFNLPGMKGIFGDPSAFYFMALPGTVYMIAATFVELYLFCLITSVLPSRIVQFCGFMSRNINRIYCAHWIIILNVFGILLKNILGIQFDLSMHLLHTAVVLAISCFAAYLLERRAKRRAIIG